MSSCDRSQNMDNASHYSTQEFECTNSNTCADGRNVFMHVWESPRRVYLGQDDNIRSQITEEHQRVIGQEENGLRHAEDPLIAKHCCLSGNNLTTATSSEAPSSKHEAKFYSDCQSETEAQRHDGSPPRALNPAALNQTLTPTKLRSPKDDNKKRGKRPSSGASATNQKAQRQSQTGSFRKLRSEKSTKRDLTSILKPPFSKTSEQKKEQMREARVKIERCDRLCLKCVMQNPVKDVRRPGESVKEGKKFTTEKGVKSEEADKIQEVANILLTLKRRKC